MFGVPLDLGSSVVNYLPLGNTPSDPTNRNYVQRQTDFIEKFYSIMAKTL